MAATMASLPTKNLLWRPCKGMVVSEHGARETAATEFSVVVFHADRDMHGRPES